MVLVGWITYVCLRYFGNSKLKGNPVAIRKTL
jgi:hypothetical protein